MQQPQSTTDQSRTLTSACESTESEISKKEERDFVRRNILLQLETPLALSADEIINKLMGLTIRGDGPGYSLEGNPRMTPAQVIADDSRACLDHKSFLYWHNQHQKVKPKMRVYASKIAAKSTVKKIFLNMLRMERLHIVSKDGDRVFLAVIEGNDAKAPSRSRRIVRGFRTYTDADRAYFRSHETGSSETVARLDDAERDGCTIGELMDRNRPGWRDDDSLFDETGIEMARFSRYVSGVSIPRSKDAEAIAEALGVTASAVISACRKCKSEAGLTGKKTLATWRESRGLSVKDLATRSGVCVLSIKKYEKGFYPRLEQTRKALVKALNVGLSNVMWGSSVLGKSGSEPDHQETKT